MSFFSLKSPVGRSVIFCAVFFAVEFLGSIGIGVISIRNIVLGMMILYLFVNRAQNIRYNITPVKYLFVYYIYVAFIGLFSDLYDGQGYTLVFARMLPSAIVFFFALKFINGKKMLNYILLILPVWVIIDGVVTILQGVNYPLGWVLASITKSSDNMGEGVAKIELIGNSIGTSSASGLLGSVVGNGFFLASYGLLFCIPLLYTRKIWGVIYSFLIFLICVIALFYNQQRIAFFAYLLMACCIYLYYIVSSKSYKTGLLIFLIYVMILYPQVGDKITGDMGRLSNVNEKEVVERTRLTESYFSEYFIQPDNFILGNRTKWEITHDGETPHNMFAETGLQGGVFGLVLYVLFLIKLFRDIIISLFRRRIKASILAGIILSIVIISLTHSSGFHSGVTFAVLACALYILSKRF